ncbi:flavodoxin domain-containing protein [Bacillus sp. B-jedd]|uniref:flavodoxin domain-containing protein n=1 Tax=Bacillus sp. B-jedd TaxID=1476857 RepID=UPI000B1A2872
MNYRIAIIYTSVTGNTKELAELLCSCFEELRLSSDLYEAKQFSLFELKKFDAVVFATYTWGNGEIPAVMRPLYEAFEQQNVQSIITGVAGTGDSFYPNFCGAVDLFKDMLYVKSNLAATLKVELAPQESDIPRCKLFAKSILKRLEQSWPQKLMEEVQ